MEANGWQLVDPIGRVGGPGESGDASTLSMAQVPGRGGLPGGLLPPQLAALFLDAPHAGAATLEPGATGGLDSPFRRCTDNQLLSTSIWADVTSPSEISPDSGVLPTATGTPGKPNVTIPICDALDPAFQETLKMRWNGTYFRTPAHKPEILPKNFKPKFVWQGF